MQARRGFLTAGDCLIFQLVKTHTHTYTYIYIYIIFSSGAMICARALCVIKKVCSASCPAGSLPSAEERREQSRGPEMPGVPCRPIQVNSRVGDSPTVGLEDQVLMLDSCCLWQRPLAHS